MLETEKAEIQERKLSPEVLEKLGHAKTQIHSTLGQVVLAMSSVARYRSQTLADLAHLVIDPLIRDRIAIAQAGPQDGGDTAVMSPAAVAIWAKVSEEADAKIREQVQAGVFPVRLKADEWNSGEIVWLLDVIAPTRKLATAVLANFNKIAKQETIRIHPLIAKLVDGDVLEKLRGASPSDDATGALN